MPEGELKAETLTMDQYERICKTEAPYPLNYLPCSRDPYQKHLGVLVGMMIHKGMFK
jgi:hypothetical protein